MDEAKEVINKVKFTDLQPINTIKLGEVMLVVPPNNPAILIAYFEWNKNGYFVNLTDQQDNWKDINSVGEL